MAETLDICAFSDGNDDITQFATVSSDGQLKVWDSASNDLLAVRSANLTDPTTSIVWERWNTATAETPRKKKKAKKAAQPTTATARILIGTLQGNVMVFSHQSNATIQMKQKHGGRVNGVTWGKDADTAYSCSDDHYIYQWSLSEGKATKKFRSDDDEPITAVTYCGHLQSEGVEALFYAASRITILDIANDTKLKQLVGHANPINTLQLTPTNHIVSASLGQADDTLIYAWSSNASSPGTKSEAAFDVGEKIVCTDIAIIDNTWRMLAVTSEGIVKIFNYDSASKSKKKPRASVGGLKFVTGDIPSEAVPIFSASFAKSRSATHILTARGTCVKPVLEEVMYVNEADNTPATLELVREAVTGGILAPKQTTGLGSASQDKRSRAEMIEATIVGTSAIAKPSLTKTVVNEDDKTIAEKVKALGNTSSLAPVSIKAKVTPTAGSLVHMLAQALHSNDKALIEECLSNTNEAIVRTTVSRLPPPLAVKFLTIVVGKLQARPTRGIMLIVWIRAVLLVHTSYLMTVPDLPEILSGMYNLVDARLAVFPRLLKLSGRLDLLLSQVLLKSEGNMEQDEEEDLQVPLITYDDDESSDESDEELDAADFAESDDEDAWEIGNDEEEDEDNDDDDDDDNMDEE
eukprot:m.169004 g.169004  ORF g.169004 m.169004 type:complete len:635 (-) comp31544_c0_seq1:633-2537(-)